MGLFDKIVNTFKSTSNKSDENIQTPTDMKKLPSSDKYRDKIYKKFYKSYPVMPFISLDREKNTNWLEQADAFPKQSIIPIKMMTPIFDGLLPGHIYQLYWISKNGQKKIPSYFEYKYGIDFEKEKQVLINKGYLIDCKLTKKGIGAIDSHYDIIEAHSPETASSQKAQNQFLNDELIYIEQTASLNNFTITKTSSINDRNLMLVSDCDKSNILEDIELINSLLKKLRIKLNIQESLCIPSSEIIFNKNFNQKLYTYFEYNPITATGKTSKFPLELYITTRDHYESMPIFDCFGSIGYLKSNSIGSATLNFWYKNIGYHINLGSVNNKLTVKKVAHTLNGTKTTIYKK